MLLARVEGQVWGARKAASLEDYRLLVVRPLTARGGEPAGSTLVVVDQLGAGPGELVLVAHGSRVRDLTVGPEVATKEVTVAIVDRATVGETTLQASVQASVQASPSAPSGEGAR